MRIVYCTIECSSAAGTERTLALQANWFADRGAEVHIVTTDRAKNPTNAFRFSERIVFHHLAIDYEETDGRHSVGKYIRRWKKGRLHRRRLTELLTAIRPDVTVALFNHEATFLHKIKDESKKVEQFHFSHDFVRLHLEAAGLPRWRQWLLCFTQWRRRRHIRHYDAFVVLTEEDARTWERDADVWGRRALQTAGTRPAALRVLPNAVALCPPSGADAGARRVISVGRLSREKGFDKLLEAWSLVAPLHPDWTLDIYGRGELEDDLRRDIGRLGLAECVRLCPPTPDIEQRYLAASIYAMTSRNEGFPMVLPEAMACGLPCVSFACPCGPAEIITDGEDGYLVPPGDVRALADRLLELMGDEELRRRMGAAARRNIRRFAPGAVMERWEALFSELCGVTVARTH